MPAVTYPVTFGDTGGSFTTWLQLLDSGAGALNTAVYLGSGSATFTRATAGAARLSTGAWNLGVAINAARSHYLPNLTYGGYLAEGAATQLALNPRDMTQAAWVAVTMTTAQTSAGLEGAANSCTRLTATGANATLLQTLVAAATTRTYSCFIKRITGTGTIGICQDGATFTDVTSQITSTGFTQVQLSASQLNAVFGIRLGTSTDAIDVDCNQFEAGAFATSPIPSAGTRSADLLTYPVAGNISASVGTVYAEVASEWSTAPATAPIVVGLDAAATLLLSATASGASTQISTFDGTNTLPKAGVTNWNNAVQKVALGYSGSTMSITGSKLAVATGAFDGLYGSTAIAIGAATGGTNPWYGTIRNIRLWQTRLSDADLSAITG